MLSLLSRFSPSVKSHLLAILFSSKNHPQLNPKSQMKITASQCCWKGCEKLGINKIQRKFWHRLGWRERPDRRFSHQIILALSSTVKDSGHLSFFGLLILFCHYCYTKLRVGAIHSKFPFVSNARNIPSNTHTRTRTHTHTHVRTHTQTHTHTHTHIR